DPEPGLEIHAAVATETSAGPTVLRVQRDELRLCIGDEDPAAALSARRRGLIEPGRDTAAREVAVADVPPNLRIEDPPLSARGRIERDHPPEWRVQVHGPIHHPGRGLAGGTLVLLELRIGLPGAVGPGHHKAAHVVPRDPRLPR